MQLDSKALQVTVFCPRTACARHLGYLYKHEIAGATGFRAIAGFGMPHHMHISQLVERWPIYQRSSASAMYQPA